MKYYIISGEPSGDLHGSNLIKELKVLDPEAEFRAWGGDLMLSQGADIVKHYRDLAFMGFVEVIQNLRTIMRNISFCKKDITGYKPDVVILIDYPGFNLRIAEFAKKSGFKVFYYISPTLWAWRKSRIKIIRKYVDRMFVILPFEKPFYKSLDYDVDFVGHPLLDSINSITEDSDDLISEFQLSDKKIITLLPGSRTQEIKRMLPIMLELIDFYPDFQFVIGGAPVFDEEFYLSFCGGKQVKIIFGRTHDLLAISYAALVTSGTATLEAALFNVPEVVCYQGGAVSFFIAKMVANVDYISLPNLIMEKKVVTELIQKDMNTLNLKNELDKIIIDKTERTRMLDEFNLLRNKLGGKGASKKLAEKIISYI